MALVRLTDLDVAFDGQRVLLRVPSRGFAARVPPQAVAVLALCDVPRERDEIVRRMGPMGGQLYDGLADAGLLVPADEASATPQFFRNFASLDTHRRMLADRVRVDAYRDGLHELVTPETVAVDAGTGSGVLACLAARAGARAVYGIDNAEVLAHARAVVDASGVADVVTLVPGDFSQTRLPERASLLVTETFGALAWAEGAAPDLDALLQHACTPDCVVVPSDVELWVAPLTDSAFLEELFAGFAAADGIDFSALRLASTRRGITAEVEPEHLGADGVQVCKTSWPGVGEARSGTVRFDVDVPIVALCGWFDLQMSPSVRLSTSPSAPRTHWHQVVLPLEPPLSGAVELELEVREAHDDRRAIELVGTARSAAGDRPLHWRIR